MQQQEIDFGGENLLVRKSGSFCNSKIDKKSRQNYSISKSSDMSWVSYYFILNEKNIFDCKVQFNDMHNISAIFLWNLFDLVTPTFHISAIATLIR